MKSYSIFTALFLFFGIGLIGNSMQFQRAEAQQLRFGFVNSNVIMSQFDEAIAAQRRFENLVTGWETELMNMIEELQQEYDDFQQKQAMMTEPARIEAQQRLIELEQEINRFQREKFGQGGMMAAEQERIFRPILQKIFAAIEEIAREENLHFVFDKTDEVPVLLYAEPRFDITYKVLDHLRRGNR